MLIYTHRVFSSDCRLMEYLRMYLFRSQTIHYNQSIVQSLSFLYAVPCCYHSEAGFCWQLFIETLMYLMFLYIVSLTHSFYATFDPEGDLLQRTAQLFLQRCSKDAQVTGARTKNPEDQKSGTDGTVSCYFSTTFGKYFGMRLARWTSMAWVP